jgi:hypothetical protein
MKKNKLSSRLKNSGEGLVLIIIVLAILGAGLWYLYSTKAATDSDARRYGHEVINRLVINRDRALLDQDLGPQAKMDLPPSQRDYMIQRFAQFGVPSQPIQIDDNVTFDSYFFQPHGYFTAHLNYPAQPVTLEVAISQGTTKWLIENITVSTQPMH